MSNSEQIQPKRKAWSMLEDQMLQDLRQKQCLDWIEVARRIGGRNPSQCAQRWKRIKGFKLRRQWTEEEDDKLRNLVKEYGYQWSKISKLLPNRSGKQIREHYLNQLHPQLNNEPWSQEEDEKLLKSIKMSEESGALFKKSFKVDQKTVLKTGSIHTFEINTSRSRIHIILFQKEQMNLIKTEQKLNSIVSVQSQEQSPSINISSTQQYLIPVNIAGIPSVNSMYCYPQFSICYPYFQFAQPQYYLQCLPNAILQ